MIIFAWRRERAPSQIQREKKVQDRKRVKGVSMQPTPNTRGPKKTHLTSKKLGVTRNVPR